LHATALFVALPMLLPPPSPALGEAIEALEVRLLRDVSGSGVRNLRIEGEGTAPHLELPGTPVTIQSPETETETSVAEGVPRGAGSSSSEEGALSPIVEGDDLGGPSPRAGPEPAAYLPAVPAEVISPAYPSRARRRRQEGEVRLWLAVDAVGRVREVSVLESSGVSALDSAALEAASSASFRPAKSNGTAIPSSLRLTVVFALEADPEG
jgi:periplasmic protein TonB